MNSLLGRLIDQSHIVRMLCIRGLGNVSELGSDQVGVAACQRDHSLHTKACARQVLACACMLQCYSKVNTEEALGCVQTAIQLSRPHH